MKEKMVKVTVGGYPRMCRESNLEKMKAEAEKMIEHYTKLGIPRKEVEGMLKIEIVKDE